MNTRVKSIQYSALFAAIIVILAQIKIDLSGLVPITLQTLGVYIAGLLLKPKDAFLAVLVYVLLGAIGLPVFAGFQGGMGSLLGPTGGYIFSFPIMAYVISYSSVHTKNTISKILGLGVGTLLCYTIGTAWFMFVTSNPLWISLTWCVFPFIIGDGIKILCAMLLAYKLQDKLRK